MFIEPLVGLLHSRKFLVALLDLVQILVLNYLKVSPDVWGGIHTVLLIVIGAIALEDSAEKFGSFSGAGVVASHPEDSTPVGVNSIGGN